MPIYESLIPVFFCLFVTLILPRLNSGLGTFLTLVLLGGFVLIHKILDPFSNFWLQILLPAVILIVGYSIVVVSRLWTGRKFKQKDDADSTKNDKTLGLFYQQQGMLDLAFEKFQSIPREGDVNDLLYDLGLEYEKKGQIKRALRVYKSIAGFGRENEEPDDGISGDEEAEVETTFEAQSAGHSTTVPEGGAQSRIGRFEVSEEILQDCVGVIYNGKDSNTGAAVVIKTVKFSQFENDHLAEIKNLFYRETECLHQLNHSNIAKVSDSGEEENIFYVVMEDMEGESLKDYTKKGQLLSIRETLCIIGQAADALDYAHKNNVVHQYISPDSIIRLKETKDAKVINFGMGWIPSVSKTKTSSLHASYFYMSPEQIAGKKVDGRSDIFSLGVVLFEMLTGESPFAGEDIPAVMLKISKEKHPSPRLFNPKVPRIIEKIIDRALEKNLEKRYQSAGQMADHLKRVVTRIDEIMAQKM